MQNETLCECGVPASFKTSAKGNNYYSCSGASGMKCKFYQPLQQQQQPRQTSYSNRSMFQPTAIMKRPAPQEDISKGTFTFNNVTTPIAPMPLPVTNNNQQPQNKEDRLFILELLRERMQKDKEMTDKLNSLHEEIYFISQQLERLLKNSENTNENKI
jgi:hypothetical protein